ncbi:Hsp70 nucleotide exchange factor FES1 [Golovinomyces cichoracearum]|uniref:Hsp70 nucleotide exchange factor FES1 n=1 Tax=Golovinomyces cichoracearum TaxID=62708 RepID=A0A420HL16_9PEZI|nr:Hsp70 nucleotide exchange factor FES1 [Golovinomyces cichoracearum]
MDPGLSKLLQWSVANSSEPADGTPVASNSQLDPNIMNALFGGPSDAELMKSSMAAIRSSDPEITHEDKLIAFDNFEQLIENLDNANNLEATELWDPLLDCLNHEEGEFRKMAAWCIGTAVQNNKKSQDMLIAKSGLPTLVKLATANDEGTQIRLKAIYALSSACRNHQPAMDIVTAELKNLGKCSGTINAGDMDACDQLMGALRNDALTKP